MSWRIRWIGMKTNNNNETNYKIFKCYSNFFQFAFSGLVPGDALKLIENAALNDEVKLQTGFEAYDECTSKSNKLKSF